MPSRPAPRAVVGVTCDYHAPKSGGPFARVNAGYFDAVLAAGGLPVLIAPMRKDNFPQLDALLEMVSAVVMVGGMDLAPRKQGQPMPATVQPMPARREDSDRYLLTKIVERKLPVLG